jgi:uncharacterized protein YaaW (UPF0174 family)
MIEVNVIYYEISTKEKDLLEINTEQKNSKDWRSKQNILEFMNNS